MFIRAAKDIYKYRDYINYNVIVNLKIKVSNTILGYFWWLLEPFLHMAIYTLIIVGIFDKGDRLFPLHVFCGLLSWKWFTSTLSYSSNCLKANSGILNQVYIPKFILPLQELISNLFRFLFGFLLIFIMMIFYKIIPTIHLLELVIVILLNGVFVFSLSLITMHIGVYVQDIRNLLSHINRIWWYLSPGIYSLTIIPEKYRWLYWLNPNTAFFESYRNIIIRGTSPNYIHLVAWAIVFLIILYLGLKLLYRNDRNYTKVI